MTDADQGSATNRAVDFSYDSVYNRTLWTDTLGPTSVGYTDNALHQYTAVGAVTPTYDNNGNITSGYGGGLTLTYDCENRLTTAGSVSFGYDLLGRRLSRTYSTSTTVYVYDGPHIIAEYSGGSLTKKYIYGPGMDNPVVMINVSGGNETWYYYYADALGSIRLITNSSGVVVESYTYDVYGQPRIMTSAGTDVNWLTEDVTTGQTSAIGNRLMFTARDWDSTTGLYYYRFRDYSPTLGRFLQPDPIGYADSMNLYQYCNNNPIKFTDPWGLLRTGVHDKIHPGDGDLDSGWTHPWNPFSTGLHFRDRNDVEKELRDAVRNQDRSNWNSLKHQGEDTFSHKPGIGGVLDHMLNPDLDDFADVDGAQQWSDDWEDLYDLNPSMEDLAEEADEWVGKKDY